MRSRMQWRITAFVLSLLLLSASAAYAANQTEQVKVYPIPLTFEVDGAAYAPPAEQQGFIYNNSTYVPLRFAAYSLGQAVRWSNETLTVTVVEPTAQEAKTIASYNQSHQTASKSEAVGASKAERVKVVRKEVSYNFYGELKQPDASLPGMLIGNTLYVPVRFFAESVGHKLAWDSATKTVKAAAGKPAEPVKDGEQPANPEDPGEVSEDGGELPGAGGIPAPGGGAGGVPGGGPAAGQESYDRIIADAEASIRQLESRCRGELASLYLDYAFAGSKEEREGLISSGYAALARCDSSFEGLMQTLSNRLTASGHNTDVIAAYREQYEATKLAAMAALLD